MTDAYKQELTDRLMRLNATRYLLLKRTLRRMALCLCFLAVGYFGGQAMPSGTGLHSLIAAHFGAPRDGLTALVWIRAAMTFAAPDLTLFVCLWCLGYTLFARTGARLLLAGYGVRLGWVLACLLAAPAQTGGLMACVFFAAAKLILYLAAVLVTLAGEDFSYQYRDLCGRFRHPFLTAASLRYSLGCLSVTGFAVLVDLLYLLFLHIGH